MTTERTLELVHAYYDGWKGGGERLDEAKLRRVLMPKIGFESPLSRRDDAAELIEAIARFAKSLKSVHFLQTIAAGNEAAVIYDCELTGPMDRLRCAEFFRVEDDRIAAIRLVFDATEYRRAAKG
jgi:hypothetical protein